MKLAQLRSREETEAAEQQSSRGKSVRAAAVLGVVVAGLWLLRSRRARGTESS